MNTEKIDKAIGAVSDMITDDPENVNYKTIEALAVLTMARAMIEITANPNLATNLSIGLTGKQLNQVVKQ